VHKSKRQVAVTTILHGDAWHLLILSMVLASRYPYGA